MSRTEPLAFSPLPQPLPSLEEVLEDAAVVDLPMTEIENISYRGRWTGGRSPRFVQEIVLHRRDGETFLIPLSRDAGVTNHEALARILPPEVIDAYLAALDRRGLDRPAAYSGR